MSAKPSRQQKHRSTLRASQNGLERLNQQRQKQRLAQTATALIEVAGTEATLKRFWLGKSITDDVFRAICHYLGVVWQDVVALSPRIDLNQAPETACKGRQRELGQLQQWLQDGCQLIAILGMGGVGKTTLSVALAKQLAEEFDVVLWRSLKDAPLPTTLFTDLLSSLLDELLLEVPVTLDDQIAKFVDYLTKHRCLILLDNTESILQGGELVGQYRPGYEAYGQALRRIAETRHHSCILITSREKSREFALLEGRGLPVCCLQLLGLNDDDARVILKEFNLTGAAPDWRDLIASYSGNPLAMRLVAATIRDDFSGDIATFLEQFTAKGTVFMGDTQWLLDEQFQRLSPLEVTLMYWLAIAREAVSIEQLQSYLVPPVPKAEMALNSLRSLVHRSLVERAGRLYTLQPVVMEYVTNQLIQQAYQGLSHNRLDLLNSHSLMQATAKDYVRESQIRLIVKPIQDQIEPFIQHHLVSLLNSLRTEYAHHSGYAAGNLLNLLIQMGVDLTGLDFSQLAIWQAYLRDIQLHRVNFTAVNFHQTVFSETIGNTLNLAFHSNGHTLATVDDKGWLYLWDLTTDRQILATEVHLEWVFAIALSPDGHLIATAGLDPVIKLWQWEGEQLTLVRSLVSHEIGIAALAFSPDGTLLASASADRTVKLWHVATGQLHHTLHGHSELVRAVTFSPDGQWVVSGSWDHTIRIWDQDTGACCHTLTGHTQAVEAIAPISLPGMTNGLVSGSYDRTLKLWDLQTGNCVQTLQGHRDRICTVACTTRAPDGDATTTPTVLIASAGDDQTIRLWDAASGECRKTWWVGSQRVWTVAFDPSGEFLASGHDDRLLQLWHLPTGQRWKTIHGYENLTAPIGFNADSTVMYTFNFRDRQLCHWDCQTGHCGKTISLDAGTSLQARLSPDGQMVAIAGLDHTIRLFTVEQGTCLQTLTGHQGWVRAVTFSSNQHQLASGSGDGTIRLWDLATGDCTVLTGHTSPVQCVAFSPDGSLLASGSWDQTIKLWQVETGELVATLTGDTRRIEDLVFSPDGNTLFSCSLDGTVRVWLLATQQCSEQWQVAGNGVVCLSLSPNGRWLASAIYRGNIQVRDRTNPQFLLTLEGNVIYGFMTFAADNRTLAVRNIQGDCQLWDVTTGHCLQTFHIPRLYEGLNFSGATGLTKAQQQTLQLLGATEV